MTTTRRRLSRPRRLAALSEGASWWLDHGGYLDEAEARRLGFEHPARSTIEVFSLNGCSEGAPNTPYWTRRRLREAGYGPQIDALIASSRAPADDHFSSSKG